MFDWICELIVLIFLNYGIYLPSNLIVWMLWHRSYHCNFCKPYVLQWLIGYINLLAVIFSKKIKEFVVLDHGS